MLGRILISAVAVVMFMFTMATQSFAASLPKMANSVEEAKSGDLLVKVGRRHHRGHRGHHWRGHRGHHWRGHRGHRWRGHRGHRWRGHRRGYRHFRHYYYGSPYYYYDAPYYYYPRRYRGNRCSYWHRKCVAKWGRGNGNYRGCMKYHRCY